MNRLAIIALLSVLLPSGSTAAATAFEPAEIRVTFVAPPAEKAPAEKPGKKVAADAPVAPPPLIAIGTAYLHTDETALVGATSVAIADHGPVDGSTARDVQVTFATPAPMSATGTRTEWKTELTITGMKPLTVLERKAVVRFTVGGKPQTRSATYTITNRAKTFSWTIAPESKSLVTPPDSVMTVTVTATGDRGTNIGVASSSLQSTETEYKVGRESVSVCTNSAGVCLPPIIPSGVPTPVYVRFASTVPHGTYAGTVELRIDESAEMKSFPLTFHRTSNPIRLLGAFLIILGILTSIWITMFSRNAIAVAEALTPAARLRELADARINRVTECRAERYAPNTLQALEDIVASLATSELRKAGYLPRMVSNPFAAAESASAGYAAFLKKIGSDLETLGYVIDSGICRAAKKKIDFDNPKQRAAFVKAVDALDKLDFAQKPEVLAPLIVTILATLDNDLMPPGVDNAAPVLRRADDFPTTEQLQLRVSWISGTVWITWAIITTIAGCLALIATDHGFGTWMDLAKCFLWGLGVQTAGQQLQNLTPASVTSALGVTAPKS